MCAERNDVNQMQSFWIHEFLRVGLIIPWRVVPLVGPGCAGGRGRARPSGRRAANGLTRRTVQRSPFPPGATARLALGPGPRPPFPRRAVQARAPVRTGAAVRSPRGAPRESTPTLTPPSHIDNSIINQCISPRADAGDARPHEARPSYSSTPQLYDEGGDGLKASPGPARQGTRRATGADQHVASRRSVACCAVECGDQKRLEGTRQKRLMLSMRIISAVMPCSARYSSTAWRHSSKEK